MAVPRVTFMAQEKLSLWFGELFDCLNPQECRYKYNQTISCENVIQTFASVIKNFNFGFTLTSMCVSNVRQFTKLCEKNHRHNTRVGFKPTTFAILQQCHTCTNQTTEIARQLEAVQILYFSSGGYRNNLLDEICIRDKEYKVPNSKEKHLEIELSRYMHKLDKVPFPINLSNKLILSHPAKWR